MEITRSLSPKDIRTSFRTKALAATLAVAGAVSGCAAQPQTFEQRMLAELDGKQELAIGERRIKQATVSNVVVDAQGHKTKYINDGIEGAAVVLFPTGSRVGVFPSGTVLKNAIEVEIMNKKFVAEECANDSIVWNRLGIILTDEASRSIANHNPNMYGERNPLDPINPEVCLIDKDFVKEAPAPLS